MEIVICKTKEEASRKAAEMINAAVKANPKIVLGLATGSTPVDMYKEMIKAVKAKKVSYRQVRSWNLDEYWGLPGTHDQSYRYFMDKNLFDSIDIKKSNTHVLNGLAKDWRKEVKAYEAAIKKAGGIDIQLLGIGSNGHIAFNEPADAFQRWSHVVALKESTIKDNSRFFDSIEEVPTHAVTMGIGSIMQAKRILIIALGKNKAKAIKQLIDGNVTPDCPASVLQFHTDVTLMLDRDAASLL